MTRKRERVLLTLITYIAAVIFLLAGVVWIGSSKMRMRVRTDTVRFKESAKKLNNPNRGFYYIYDFSISNEEMDYEKLVAERYREDSDTSLTFIQICLQEYQTGKISEAGMENIARLFQALETIDKQLIVRFVYDKEGRNLLYEPHEIETVLEHMRQLGPVLQEHSDQIFTIQGLFVGNWGEMHGTRYDSKGSLRRLALQLAEVTDEHTYLAVRTPAQWRIIMQKLDGKDFAAKDGAIAGKGDSSLQNAGGSDVDPGRNIEEILGNRLGLFNDGMLGNETDYGTYGTMDCGLTGTYDKWKREEELQFQSKLCRQVPNGGEVIDPNSYNDIENAMKDMKTMHITYLNRQYDGEVFEKWTNSIVREKGCFDGMDGCTYIERHLGYRLLIDEVDFIYRFWENRLFANIRLRNVGFAPMYRKAMIELILCDETGNEAARYKVDGNLRELAGGNEAEQKLKIRTDLELNELGAGKYEVYLLITDSESGKPIQLANEQEEGVYGYRIGKMEYR